MCVCVQGRKSRDELERVGRGGGRTVQQIGPRKQAGLGPGAGVGGTYLWLGSAPGRCHLSPGRKRQVLDESVCGENQPGAAPEAGSQGLQGRDSCPRVPGLPGKSIVCGGDSIFPPLVCAAHWPGVF